MAKNDGRLGHALNSIVSSSGAAVKIIARESLRHSTGWPQAWTQGCA